MIFLIPLKNMCFLELPNGNRDFRASTQGGLQVDSKQVELNAKEYLECTRKHKNKKQII